MNRKDFIKKYSQKTYLGDGLYVHFDGYHFVLSTERYDQRDPKWDIVGLEPIVFDDLIQYRKLVYRDAENLTDDAEENE
jgi:hypothetical protein